MDMGIRRRFLLGVLEGYYHSESLPFRMSLWESYLETLSEENLDRLFTPLSRYLDEGVLSVSLVIQLEHFYRYVDSLALAKEG